MYFFHLAILRLISDLIDLMISALCSLVRLDHHEDFLNVSVSKKNLDFIVKIVERNRKCEWQEKWLRLSDVGRLT